MAETPTERGPIEEDDQSPAEVAGPRPPQEVLADPGQRLLARIVDTLIVGLPVVMVIREVVHGHHAEVIATPIVAGALFLYEWPQLALWGRTLGKRFAGVQVVREGAAAPPAPDESPGGSGDRSERSEGRVGVFRALLRAGVYAAPIAVRPVPILGIIGGLLWVANAGALYEGDRRQAGHDRLAGTVVVKRPGRSGS
ncbi:RDD family protein [Actinomadura barringtoniae]|uniref:RDD family protein n=1 Tax=Actinomadura barringtoniae TaxID=1427535 RepID=A0A939T9L5_9ACTN|nr:RDD family protein [Actinomadura barringtoniae]MBO2451522.1 RDD family protein [Actinomadura barringtoniae]